MECAICLEKCETYITLKCKHTFHFGCINDWAKKSHKCPLCRKFMGYYCISPKPKEGSFFPSFRELYPINNKKTIIDKD